MLSRSLLRLPHKSLPSTPNLLHRHQFSSSPLRLRQIPYSFSQITSLTKQKNTQQSHSSSAILIDVREPNEYEAGSIPTSINLPLSSLAESLKLAMTEFKDRFGFEKPKKEVDELVFYCQKGVRSSKAAEIAEREGFQKVGNYKGSYAEWSSQFNSQSTTSTGEESAIGKAAQRGTSSSSSSGALKNPNLKSGHGEGADGGIDLKAMNQKEEKRAEGRKQQEKKGEKTLAGSKEGAEESESVTSGAEMSGGKKFE